MILLSHFASLGLSFCSSKMNGDFVRFQHWRSQKKWSVCVYTKHWIDSVKENKEFPSTFLVLWLGLMDWTDKRQINRRKAYKFY